MMEQKFKNIWTIPNFLTHQECEDLIIFSENKGYEEAKVSLESGPKLIKGIRNNYRIIYKDQELASRFWLKLKKHYPDVINENNQTYKALGMNEQFRFYRYENNQRFKKHKDGSVQLTEKIKSKITFMIYLNDNFSGGETYFTKEKITPIKGTALCFYHHLKHEGLPVTQGIKYILRSDIFYQRKEEENNDI